MASEITGLGRSSSRANGTGNGAAMNGEEERQRAERVMVTLQTMLRQERIFYERKCKEYVQNPSVRVKDSLTESEQRIADLEKKFAECTHKLEFAMREAAERSSSSSLSARSGSNVDAEHNSLATNSSQSSIPASVTTNGPSRAQSDSNSMPTFESETSGQDAIVSTPPSQPASGLNSFPQEPQLPIMSMERSPSTYSHKPTGAQASAVAAIYVDYDDYDESVATDNLSGPFSSLDNLILDPARMAVFIRFLMDDTGQGSDPDSLFFYLLTRVYERQKDKSTRDIRRSGRAIFGLFFAENAPMHVDIKPAIVQNAEVVLENKSHSSDVLLAIFKESRIHLATTTISKQLARFREKRALGFGSLFGEDEVLERVTSKEERNDFTKKLLSPLLKNLAGMDPSFSKLDQNVPVRNAALSMALLTFLEDCGVIVDTSHSKGNNKSQKKSALAIFGKGKKDSVKIREGHHFYQAHYNSPVYCDYCDGLLWGLGYQGLTCQTCGFNVHHKSACSNSLKDMPCQSESYDRPSHQSTSRFSLNSIAGTSAVVKPSSSLTSIPSPISPQPTHSAVTAITVGETTPSIKTVSLDDVRSQSGASVLSVPTDVAPGSGMTHRPRQSNLSLSVSAAERAKRVGTSVARAQSLNDHHKRPTRVRKHDLVRDDSGGFNVQAEHKTRSPSLNDITSPEDDGRSSTSPDRGGSFSPTNDPEMEYEEELIPWVEIVQSKEPGFIKKLSQKDISRQSLIHELIHTEATHLRNLKLIQNCFYMPLSRGELLPQDQVDKLFPHLDTLIVFHRNVLQLLRNKMDPDRFGYVTAIADVFRVFAAGVSDDYRVACSNWVSGNQENLDFIRKTQQSSQRFATFLKTCEATEALHRKQLDALTSCVMQRLTKYPLLLEGIRKYTLREADEGEHTDLTKALEHCRGALSFVNAHVRKCENAKYLLEVSAKLDAKDLENSKDFTMSSYRNIDLPLMTLVHHSDLLWRTRRDVIPVHALLLTDLIVLLEYNENKTQYYLRVHGEFGSVIRVNDLHVRSVAVDKKAFYLVDLKGEPPRMYSLQAESVADCQRWLTATAEVTEARKLIVPTSPAVVNTSQGRPLPQQPVPPPPPHIVKHEPVITVIPSVSSFSDEDDEEEAGQKEEDAFEEHLLSADQSISQVLRSHRTSQSSLAPLSPQHGRRSNSIEPVMESCVQQAQIVSTLARQLLQPQQLDAEAGQSNQTGLRPANYQLVDASQQLSLQLASMQALFMKREHAIMAVQRELDELRERSGNLDAAAADAGTKGTDGDAETDGGALDGENGETAAVVDDNASVGEYELDQVDGGEQQPATGLAPSALLAGYSDEEDFC